MDTKQIPEPHQTRADEAQASPPTAAEMAQREYERRMDRFESVPGIAGASA